MHGYYRPYVQVFQEDRWRPADFPDDLHPVIKDLIERSWAHNQQDRPTAQELVEKLNMIDEDM